MQRDLKNHPAKENNNKDTISTSKTINEDIISEKEPTDGKKIVQIEASVDALTKKFFSMSSFYSENITMKDKIDNLFQNISKLEGAMFTHDFRISSLEKDLVTAINKYDKIIEKSIYYPGLIGANNAKFNTFHNFIDFVM